MAGACETSCLEVCVGAVGTEQFTRGDVGDSAAWTEENGMGTQLTGTAAAFVVRGL